MEDRAFDIDDFGPVARILVIGVGGAGNNAVNRMIDDHIENVEFYVCNTDRQALATSKAPHRIPLGTKVTEGLGAGGDPSVGEEAAKQSEEEIRAIIRGDEAGGKKADMVFVAAGLGKGTGTGASPVIARIAKEEGALTIAIVTRPFGFEGPKRTSNAIEGLNKLKGAVDSIIIVSNDKLLMDSGNAPIDQAFSLSDNILSRSVKTVADLILVPSIVNLDFADVKSTLKDSGIALIGYGEGQGPQKAQEAANSALSSRLLEASISGARRAICAVTCGTGVTLYEAQECVRRINEQAGGAIDIKFGVSINANLTDTLIVAVIASDFSSEYDFTAPPAVRLPDPVLPPEGEEEEEQGEEDVLSAILPDFLRKARDEGQ